MDSILYINSDSVITIAENDILYLESSNTKIVNMLQTSLTYTSANILAGDIIEAIPAPGIGKYIDIVGLTITYKHGGINYTGDGTVIVDYMSDLSVMLISDTSPLYVYNNSNQTTLFQIASGGVVSPAIGNGFSFENKGLYVGISSPPLDGNGDVIVNIVYLISDF